MKRECSCLRRAGGLDSTCPYLCNLYYYILTSYRCGHRPRPATTFSSSLRRSSGSGLEKLREWRPCWRQLDNVALRFIFLFDIPEELRSTALRTSCTLPSSQHEPLHRRGHRGLPQNHGSLAAPKPLQNTPVFSACRLPLDYWPLEREYSSMMHSRIQTSM